MSYQSPRVAYFVSEEHVILDEAKARHQLLVQCVIQIDVDRSPISPVALSSVVKAFNFLAEQRNLNRVEAQYNDRHFQRITLAGCGKT